MGFQHARKRKSEDKIIPCSAIPYCKLEAKSQSDLYDCIR